MKLRNIVGAFLAVCLSVSVAMAMGTEKKDIVDTAIDAGSFDTLVVALEVADLVSTLKGDGPFTVFAPTDQAFAKLPTGTLSYLLKPENKSKLQSILTYHVISAEVLAADVETLTEAKTVNGTNLMLKANQGKVMVENAQVIKTDIICSNGVIHVIDTVVMPQ